MSKTSIKLVIIGHIDKVVDFELIQNHKSNFFVIEELNRISDLPPPRKNDGYLDVVYSVEEITSIMSNIQCNDICIGIMNYRFVDNFYMHRINNKTMCISIAGLEQILMSREISLENFIIKNIYEVFSFYKIFGSTLIGDVYEFVHEDTRGCLFDLNGDKNDILYNTEKPIICNECLSKMNKKALPTNFVDSIKLELETINKPLLKRIELFIKKYPLLSILATIIFSTMINILSNYIWSLIAGT